MRHSYFNSQDVRDHIIRLRIKGTKQMAFARGDGTEELKTALRFHNSDKLLVLNNTNTQRLRHLHGWHPENWADEWIVIYQDTTRYAGKDVACVRIKGDAITQPA